MIFFIPTLNKLSQFAFYPYFWQTNDRFVNSLIFMVCYHLVPYRLYRFIEQYFFQLSMSLNRGLILAKLDNKTLSDDIQSINLDHQIELFYNISKWLNPICVSIITLFGLYGNIMSLSIKDILNLFRTMSVYCLVLLSIQRIFSLYYPMRRESMQFLPKKLIKSNQILVHDRLPSVHSVRAAYLTLILSKWFVILHLPYAIIWSLLHFQLREETIQAENILLHLINPKSDENENQKYLLKTLLNLFEIMDILNYSVDFFILIMNSNQIKKIKENTKKNSTNFEYFKYTSNKKQSRLICSVVLRSWKGQSKTDVQHVLCYNLKKLRRREKGDLKIIDVVYVKFGKCLYKLNKVEKFKSRSFNKENVNSPKDLNPRHPGV
ncbi:hypothetical protein BpHYR1_035327 [Brachionus plicatilis]|uniref:Uncharacterized protein n=1 Tax=Brachionus plicatilis TaxID=10195 RepID=A0A3M7PNN0_BRAPC|nr:hypothetical protein BpHYR1_035327 [Brachionus plicatilis]